MARPAKTDTQRRASGTLRRRRAPRADAGVFPIQAGLLDALRRVRAGGGTIRAFCGDHLLPERLLYGFVQGDMAITLGFAERLAIALDLVLAHPSPTTHPRHPSR